ncbi:MAG: hypothetical protein COW01_08485 [Bdellovibrionales bacterium CG12_big_fil_rev_8_21_14_0_65_38_15]|nr:MAG: hypothetical protein COW79_04265 [Bdellovibrionales bacterium CG22_combo_CG10-13_8_21_14_all_38_13]PIQ55166.1 MAG: hypothetical protein COW01_08485 [Bdellovibrionales bacterium CG12_big_fil_rev_8_21_14_0_65_38_15]PIR29214.1 MAG: hypothetical protein COV38_11800 [Bdellovibrionales bacterium CG11_big_fil_rev_8_21_14_0_20_38_13]
MSTDTLANTTTAEVKPGVRNFRTIPEIENFYRFVYENDLRRETKLVLSLIVRKIAAANKKSRKKAKKKQVH